MGRTEPSSRAPNFIPDAAVIPLVEPAQICDEFKKGLVQVESAGFATYWEGVLNSAT